MRFFACPKDKLLIVAVNHPKLLNTSEKLRHAVLFLINKVNLEQDCRSTLRTGSWTFRVSVAVVDVCS